MPDVAASEAPEVPDVHGRPHGSAYLVFVALGVVALAGLWTAPETGAPLSINATLIVNSPLPARNSRVPSSGSTSKKRSAT